MYGDSVRGDSVLNKTKTLLLLLLILAVAAGIRLFQLSADMPLHVSSCADEGIYVHNARNKVIFGDWVLDEWNNMYISPVFNYLVYLSFSLFGVGFVQARLVSVAASLVTIWLVFRCLERDVGRGAAAVGGLLLAVNYVYVFFGKMALMEPAMLMFMAMAMYFFLLGRQNMSFFLLCGICCSLAFVTKNLAGFYFVVPYVCILLGGLDKRRLRACSRLLAGQLLVIGVWFFFFYIPNRGFIDLHNRIKIEERMPVSVGHALMNAITMFNYPFFKMLPFLSLAALAGFVLVGWAIIKRRDRGAMEVYGALWLISNFVCLSIFSWRPLRYSLSLVIPMVILSVVPIFTLYRVRAGEEGKGVTLTSTRMRAGLRAATSILLALSIILSAYHLGRAWLHPRVMWPALAREITERIPPEGTISGGPAMSAGMGIKNRLVWIHQLADYSKGDPFTRYGIDYLVVTGRELEFYKMVFPDVLPALVERSRLVYRMPLDDRGPALFIQLPGD